MANGQIRAGLAYCYYGVNDSNGWFIGPSTTAPVAGVQTCVGLTRLEGARTVPFQVNEGTRITVTGDNKPEVQFTFDTDQLPSGVLELSVRDEDFEALVQGTVVQHIGDLAVGVLQPKDRTNVDICWLIMADAKTWNSASRGVAKMESYLVMSSNVYPLGSQFQERTFNPQRVSISVSQGSRKTWGETFTEALNGTESTAIAVIRSDNPPMIDVALGNNSASAFTLQFAPVSLAKTHVYLDGVPQIPTTDFTLSGSVVTFVSPPGSSVRIHVLYETAASNLA